MTKTRFERISQCLACQVPDESPDNIEDKSHRYCSKAHPLFHIQNVWDEVNRNCLRRFNPASDLALDEAMVKYKGFLAWCKKFFMPLKPIRAGFKLYAICESASGYMCNFMIHPTSPTNTAVTMKEIVMEVTSPYLDVFHRFYTDKLYTSVAVAEELLQKKTYITGAVKSNSKGLPLALSNSVKNPDHKTIAAMAKADRGLFYGRQKGQLTCVIWKDSKVVQFLSTAHQLYGQPSDTLTRKVKEAGQQKRVQKAIHAPRQAISYTKNMGGVDRHDQLRSYYTCARKSQKWWKQLLFFLMDAARVNAYICFKLSREAAEAAAATRRTQPAGTSRSCNAHLELTVLEMDNDSDSVSIDSQASSGDSSDSDDDDFGSSSHADFTLDLAVGLIAGFAEGMPQKQQRHPLLHQLQLQMLTVVMVV
ncbi:LOW QUALITY PROTEIN: piggyBac transposable element-derived protein 4-like [Amphiura filiformis]|uniref:LOW QUALITY PROTEIN: piggyBac transposable element-derived protein 4-like n=1 Tax=Amphiura filiformis TaxID=82378 RepID=UPI003B21881C